MNRYLLELSFDGSQYHGWQVQPNGITVQQTVQTALVRFFGCEASVTGCSRTDSGVHARQFFCHTDTKTSLPPEGIRKGLNCLLPPDIRVLSCRRVDPSFHARYQTRWKMYEYEIDTAEVLSPFRYRYAYHYAGPLDVERMNVFCASVIGTHDFAGFSSSGRSTKDTVRHVYNCCVLRREGGLTFRICADGFLYNMVRILAGTAKDFGTGRFATEEAASIVASVDRRKAGETLPGQGLYLSRVSYEEYDNAKL